MAEPSTAGIDNLYAPDGLLSDANHDGYPDSLRARIVLESANTAGAQLGVTAIVTFSGMPEQSAGTGAVSLK